MRRSPALPWLAHPMPPPARGRVSYPTLMTSGLDHLWLYHQSQLYCGRQGVGPTLVSAAAAGEERGQLSCSHKPKARSLPYEGKEGKRVPLPHPCHCTGDEWQGQLPQAHQELSKLWTALLYFLDNVRNQISLVLQLIRDGFSSPVLTPSGPASPGYPGKQ